MPSLYQYTTINDIHNLTGIGTGQLNDTLISQAEVMIDQYVADFYQPPFCRAFVDRIETTVSTTTTTLTLPTIYSKNNDYYKFCQIRLSNGLELPVLSSANNLLIIPLTSGLSGNYECQILQKSKFPRDCDKFVNTKYIPSEIAQAVAYQVAFLIDQQKSGAGHITTLARKQKKSESIGENYSYTISDSPAGGKGDTLAERISPLARDILDNLSMSYQPCC